MNKYFLLFYVYVFALMTMSGSVGKSKNILIVKGTSILENEVARIVKDSLIKKGYTLKTVHVEKVADEDPDLFGGILYFNTVKSGRLVEPVDRHQKYSSVLKTKVLVCTITGELWNTTEPYVDAISAATEDLKPVEVSISILKSVYTIIAQP